MAKNEALVALNRLDLLAPENPHLQKAAKALRRRPERLAKQLEMLFATQIERAIALSLMAEFSHRPNTIRKVLTLVNNGDELKDQDIVPLSEGALSKVELMLPLIEGVLELIMHSSIDYGGLRLGSGRAVKLVMIYGSSVDDFLNGLFTDSGALADIFHMSSSSELNIVRYSLGIWENGVLPYCETEGMPYPLNLLEFFQEQGDCFDTDGVEISDHGVNLNRYTTVARISGD